MAGEESTRESPSTEGIQNAIGEQLGNLSGLLDGGINIASDAIKSGTATAKNGLEKASGLVKVCNHNQSKFILGLK